MARVRFTPNLQRHVECPAAEAPGSCVREALDGVFEQVPRLRGYVLDEHGQVRHHMVIFVDGVPVRDRRGLSDAIAPDAEIYVMQALSGG